MRLRLPPRLHPSVRARRQRDGRRSLRRRPHSGRHRQDFRRNALHSGRRPARLSRLRQLRRCVSRQARQQGSDNEAARIAASASERVGLLHQQRQLEAESRRHQTEREEQPVRHTSVRILGRLLGLRRNPLRETYHPALRRPRDGGQRNRLLVDLQRLGSVDPLHRQRRRPRPSLGQQPLRGLLRIRSRHEDCHRQPARRARRIGEESCRLPVVLRRNPRPGGRMAREIQRRRRHPRHRRQAHTSLRSLRLPDLPRDSRPQAVSGKTQPVDHRRRRSQLRHRLRRPRPRSGQR